MTSAYRALIWLGGLGLLAATGIDTASVIGRNFGWPVHGAIELIQAAVLVAGGVALVVASLGGNHAKVHLLVDRLPPARKALVTRVCELAAALFFLGLLAGSLWIAADLWHGHEQSELVGVPWLWLRLFANACLALAALLLARRFVRGVQ